MQDPWDMGSIKFKLQNIDDAHFYQMSYPQKGKKPGVLARVQQDVRREWMILRCRLEAILSPSLMVEQQCDCVES